MIRNWLRRRNPGRMHRVAPHAEWIEPRLLYNADTATLLDYHDTGVLGEMRTLDAALEYSAEASATPGEAEVRAAYALTPLQFEENAGHLGGGVDFAAVGIGYSVRLGGGGQAELVLDGASEVVRLELVGADAGTAVGENELKSRSNYLVGSQDRWVTDIANYASVRYDDVYEGIGIRYYGNQDQLEYDFLVDAGADASQLQVRFHGVESATLAANGDLLLRVAGTEREVRFQAPVSYQEGPGGRESVESHYELQADGSVRIVVGAYDTSRALVVDPKLLHATYFGEGGAEKAYGVAVDANGYVYVTGETSSSGGDFGGTRLGTGSTGSETFVAKLRPDLKANDGDDPLYITRVGGSGIDEGRAIAVDALGQAIVTGMTRSDDLATTAGADQPARNGNQQQEAFVYKLNAAGNGFVFNTYFGGAGNTDVGTGVAVDGSGNIYVVGRYAGADDNAFINKYSATGTSLMKLQYGGSGDDGAVGVAVDAAGNIYVAGKTLSDDNEVRNAKQATRAGNEEGFLVKYSAAGVLQYATYIGSSKDDNLTGVAADDSGRAYVVGRTKDPLGANFEFTAGALATTRYNHESGFLRIYNTTLSGNASMEYSTHIGGSRNAANIETNTLTDTPTAVAVSGGKVAVVGYTDTANLPTSTLANGAHATTNTSGQSAGFLLVLAPQGAGASDLVYGTYYGTGVFLNGVTWSGSNVYAVGHTVTNDASLTPGTPYHAYQGGGDGIVANFSEFFNVAPVLTGAVNPPAQPEDVPGSGTLVSDLVAGKISDVDTGALQGIAITAVDSSKGRWEVTLDGGGTWTTVTTPSANNGLLLDADTLTRVRYVPNEHSIDGATITFRAWDRSSGTAGSVAAITGVGGGSAFSVASATATFSVTAVNDAPVRDPATPINTVNATENGAVVSLGLGSLAYLPGGGSDEGGQTFSVLVTSLPGAGGIVQLANGAAVQSGSTYTLDELRTMRFAPGTRGTWSFGFSIVDNGGTGNGGIDTLAQTVTLAVSNAAPQLAATSYPMTQLEDVPGDGMLVSDLILGKVTDAGGPYGIAVTGLPTGNIGGTWQYSLDGGGSWLALTGSGANSRLLGPDARIRFLSDAQHDNGNVPGFTFRAWDGSSGVAGGTASTSSNGGSTAFSATEATVTMTITAVNDAPVRSIFSSTPADLSVREATGLVSLGLSGVLYSAGGGFDEIFGQSLSYRVSALPGSSVGTVYLSDGVTVVTAGTSYTLSQIQGMQFRPGAGVQNGTGLFTWTVRDSGGVANGGVDTLTESIRITVYNQAPTLSGTNGFGAIFEDIPGNGSRVSDLIANKASDWTNTIGIAVTSAPTTAAGSWEYTSDGGTTWNSLAAASNSNSILLSNGGQWRARFNPAANWNGTSPAIVFRAWDRSSGTPGGTADTTSNGNATAFSQNTASATVTVTPVNDAPARTDAPGVAFPPLILLDGSASTSLGLATASFGVGGGADEALNQSLVSYTVTSLPSTLGTVYYTTAGGTRAAVTLNTTYTLAQIRTMEFLSRGEGYLGTELFSIAVKDNGGTSTGVDTATFSVPVIVNRAPVLNGANAPLAIFEDFDWTGNIPPGAVPAWASPAQRAGVSVSDLISGQVLDTTGSQTGIAVIAATGNGTWQYSLDAGATWTTLTPVSNTAAMQLPADAKVRFLPGTDWNSSIGETSISFRAWDRTTGSPGTLADASYNDGPFAFSAAVGKSVVTITPRNDAPVAVGATGGTVEEGAAMVPLLASGSYLGGPAATATDEASQALVFRFTTIPSSVVIFLADGTTQVDLAGSYTLAQFRGMLFRSATNAIPGDAEVKFEVRDDGGILNNGADRANFSLVLHVLNRAPVLDGANAMTGIQEDTADNGTLVSDIVAGHITDPTGTRGIVVTAVDGANGSWQFTRDGGTSWTAFGTPDVANARLLLADALTRVRFVPNANWNGTASLTFAAWDGTFGGAGGVVDAGTRGPGTSFSAATASTTITVSAVNDRPGGGVVSDLTVTEDSGSTSLGLGTVNYHPGGGADEAGQGLVVVIAGASDLPDAAIGSITLADGTVVAPGTYTIEQLRGMRFVTAANGFGTTDFTFSIRDNGGGDDSYGQTITITVTAVNDAPVAVADVVPGTEDTQLTIPPGSLLLNDTDLEGNTLSFVGVGTVTGGTVTMVNGDIVFTPAANHTGPAGFTYTVSDGQGGTATGTVSITLAATNDAPVAVNDGGLVATALVPLEIAPSTLLGNDVDVDGDTLTIVSVAAVSNGSVAIDGNGNVVFTGTLAGPASFDYTVRDAAGVTSTARVTLNVLVGNRPPVAGADTVTGANEDEAKTINVSELLANDSDPDVLQTPFISAVSAVEGGTVTLASGVVTFTPTTNFNGNARFNYTLSDGLGGLATGSVTVVVAPRNDAPTAVADAFTIPEDQVLVLLPSQLVGNDADIDGDTLSIASVQDAVGGTVRLLGNGSVEFTPTANRTAPASFTYTASDGNGGSVTATVNITFTPQNDAPVAVDDSVTVPEDAATTITAATLLGNDSDVDLDTLSISAVTAVSGGTVSLVNGNVLFTPTLDHVGGGSFTYTVSDGKGGSASGNVTVTVTPTNDPPAAGNHALTIDEDTPQTLQPSTLLGNASDIDGDTLTLHSVQDAVNGTVSYANGVVTFTPSPNHNGTASFTYTVSDGFGGFATGTVSFTVRPVNDAPMLGADALSGTEDEPLVITRASLLANDSDAEGDALSIVAVGNAVGGSLAVSGDDFVFSPTADRNGAASFDYTVSDVHGATTTRTVTLNFAAVNDAPVARSDVLAAVEDTPRSIDTTLLLANDSDVEAQALTVVSVGNASNGTVTLSGTDILFTPNANFNGFTSFNYTVRDAGGLTSTATVTLNFAPTNDAPTAVAETFTTAEDTPITITPTQLVGNDLDVDGDTLRLASVADGTGGSVNIVGTDVVFTPDADFFGTATFSYTVTDDKGGSATIGVNVMVTPVNDAPRLVAEAFTTDEDVALDIPVGTLLANDSDVENEALTFLGVGNAVNGTVTLANGVVTFTPAPNFGGAAGFTYTVRDATGAESTATVTVNVTPLNDTPVAGADSATTLRDTPVTIGAGTLLQNDTDGDAGDTLTVTAVAPGTGGSVSLSGTDILFTPDAGFTGAASFTYTVADASGATSSATVNVTVVRPNEAPVGVQDTLATTEDNAVTVTPTTLLANDTDGNGDTLSLTGVGNATNGTVGIVNGDIVFTPTANFHGAAGFSYTVSDGRGGTSSGTVVVNVGARNDDPVAQASAITLDEGASITASVTASDVDLPAETLAYAVLSGPTRGSVVMAADGSYTYTHGGGEFFSDSFTFEVTDAAGAKSQATVTVTIAPQNDNTPVAQAATATVLEGGNVAGTVTATDADTGETLTYALVGNAAGGTVVMAANGSFTYTHGGGEAATDSFTFEVTDAAGHKSQAVVTVNVTPVNDNAPVAQAGSATVNEGASVSGTVTATDADLPDDTLTYAVVGAATRGTVVMAANGSYTYTHDGSELFTDSFTFEVTDAAGRKSQAVVSITVNPQNDNAPVAQAGTATVNEGASVSGTVTATDVDAPSESLTYAVVGAATRGTVVMNANGSYTYTHNGSEVFTDSFRFEVTDAAGRKSQAVVAITVNPQNDNAPTAQAGTASVDEGGSVTGTVSATDTDLPNDTLTYAVVGNATRGSVVMNASGGYTYTHNGSETASDSFTFEVTDAAGRKSQAVVSITVAPQNDNTPVAQAAAVTVNEGASVTGTVTATDTDLPDDALTYAVVDNPARGTVTMAANGSYTYTHEGSELFTDSFTFEVTDAAGHKSQAVVTVTVNPQNDNAPAAQAGSATVNEGAIVSGTVTATDVDVPNDTLTYAVVGNPTRGSVVMNANGGYTYTHNGSETATDSFTFEVTDAAGRKSQAVVSITVNPQNDSAPVAQAGTATVNEGAGVTGTVTATDTDLPNDALTYAVVGGATRGTVVMNASGGYTYTHDGSETTSDSFTFEVTDAAGRKSQAVVSIAVNPQNDNAPVAQASAATVNEGAIVSGTVTATDIDAPNESLTYAVVGAATRGTVVMNANGSYTYTHNGSETASDSFTFEVTDAAGRKSQAVVAITVNPQNDNAPAAQPGTASVNEGGSITGTVSASDADLPSDALTYAVVGNPTRGSVVMNANGSYTYTHDGSETAGDSFTFEVTDAAGRKGQAVVTIAVNPQNDNAPAAQASTATVNEGGSVAGSVSATDTDLPNDALTYAVVGNPTRGTVTMGANGSYTYTHDGSEVFTDSFTFEVTDAAGAKSQATVSIAVNPQDDNAPVAQGSTAAVDEGGSVTGAVTATDLDSAPETLTFTVVGQPTRGTVVMNANGGYTYTHDGSELFTDSFTFEVSDASGASSRASVVITVNPRNDHAPAAQAASITVAEGGSFTGAVTATDTDLPNDALTYAVVGAATRGTVVMNANGGYTYTHNGSETAADSFTFEVTDAAGAKSRATVAITVTPQNDNTPVAQAGSASVAEGGTVAGTVAATDTDLPNDALTYALVGNAGRGTVVLNANGSYSYTHDGSESSSDSFTFEVTDAAGHKSQASVAITVNPRNDNAPVAQAASINVNEGGSFSGAVSATDTDLPNDALSYAVVGAATRGTVVMNANGSYTYTHAGGEFFADSFTFEVTDAAGARSRATVAITVTPQNDNAPVAQAGTARVAEGGSVTGTVVATDTDLPNDALTFALVGQAGRGTVVLDANGTWTYTHDGSESTSDSFTFQVTDANGATSQATVTIGIQPRNDNAPVAQAGTAVVAEGGTVAGTVAATDADLPNDSLTYALVGGATRGALVLNANGSYSYTHDGSEVFADSFTFEVTDAAGAKSQATVTITVNPRNDNVPVAQAGSITLDEGATFTGTVTATDRDTNDTLTYAIVGNPARGTVTMNASGGYTYTHGGGEFFADSFTFEVTDAAGQKSQASVAIAITPQNDNAPVATGGTIAVVSGGTRAGSVLVSDADLPIDSLTVSLVSGPAHGLLTLDANGSYSYTHDGSVNLVDSFVFQVRDAAGATSQATVAIAISEAPNRAPVAGDGVLVVAEGAAASGTVSVSDADLPADSLTVTVVSGPARGTLQMDANGSFTYTHDGSEVFSDSFTYEVTDAYGASSRASVAITITPGNDNTPAAQGGTANVAEGGSVTGVVSASDTDLPNDVLTFGLATGPAHGTVVIDANGSYTYTHDGSENFSDRFTYTVTDANGATSQATVTITVDAVDDASQLAADRFTGQEDRQLTGNVLDNDVDVDSALQVTGFEIGGTGYAVGATATLAGVGSFTLGANGAFSFTPLADFNGAAPQVRYTVTTGAASTLDLQLAAVDDAVGRIGTAPVDVAVAEGSAASLGLGSIAYTPGGGSDEAAQVLTVTITRLPTDIGRVVLADGRTEVVQGGRYTVDQLRGMRFVAGANVNEGAGSISFTVGDGNAANTLAEGFRVSVINQAPVLDGANTLPAIVEDSTGAEGMLVADLIAGHASDPLGRYGIAVIGADTSAGRWEYSRDGGSTWNGFRDVSGSSAELLRADAQTRVRFVPNADWNGNAGGLGFRAWDGSGATASALRGDTAVHGGSSAFSTGIAQASVVVAPVNDAPAPTAEGPALLDTRGQLTAPLQLENWRYTPGGGGDEATQSLAVTITEVPAPQLGTVVLADGVTQVSAGQSYSLAEFRGMRFVAAPGSNGTGQIAWLVRDDGGTSLGGADQRPGVLRIQVAGQEPTPNAPVVVAPPTTELGAPAAPQVAAAAAPAPATPAAAPAPAARDGSGDVAAAIQGASQALLPDVSGFARQQHQVLQDFSRVSLVLPEVRTVAFNPGTIATLGEFAVTGFANLDNSGLRMTVEQFQQTLRSGAFVDELNRLKRELREEFDMDRTTSITVAGLSLGVSVAYVLWLVRGGVLLGSYLSALPAWRLLDPLPVLSRAGAGDEDDEDDAFEPEDDKGPDPLRGYS